MEAIELRSSIYHSQIFVVAGVLRGPVSVTAYRAPIAEALHALGRLSITQER
jgi:hypothetical protein